MKVQRVLHPDVICIEAWQTLREAARVMHESRIGCLAVVSGDELNGIITERDIVEAMAKAEDPQNACVFDYMTEAPATLRPDDDCSVAATEMLAAGCRHLPVMDGGRLVGMVSARDLLPLATAGQIEGAGPRPERRRHI